MADQSVAVFYEDEPDKLTRVVAKLEAPLFMGLEVNSLGPAFADMTRARRRLEQQSAEPHAARELLHQAWKLFSEAAPPLWLCGLHDDRVELGRAGHVGTGDELGRARDVAERMATLLVAQRRALPPPPWKRMTAQTWSEAAEMMGATFDAERLVLEGSRRGTPFSAHVVFRDQSPATIVRLETGRDANATEHRVQGPVASAQALVELIDELCADSAALRDPYR